MLFRSLYLARVRGRYTWNELAERVGLSHYMAVAVAVSRFRQRLQEDRDVRRAVECAAEELINV